MKKTLRLLLTALTVFAASAGWQRAEGTPTISITAPVYTSSTYYDVPCFYNNEGPVFTLSVKEDGAEITLGSDYRVVAAIRAQGTSTYSVYHYDTLTTNAQLANYSPKAGWKSEVLAGNTNPLTDSIYTLSVFLYRVNEGDYSEVTRITDYKFGAFAVAKPSVAFGELRIFSSDEKPSLTVKLTNGRVGDLQQNTWIAREILSGSTSRFKDTVKEDISARTVGEYTLQLEESLAAGTYKIKVDLLKINNSTAEEWGVSAEQEFTVSDASALPELTLTVPTTTDNSGTYVFTQARPAFQMSLSSYENVGSAKDKYSVKVEIGQYGNASGPKYTKLLTDKESIEGFIPEEGWDAEIKQLSGLTNYEAAISVCKNTEENVGVPVKTTHSCRFVVCTQTPQIAFPYITENPGLQTNQYISLTYNLTNAVGGSETNNTWVAFDLECLKDGSHVYDTAKSASSSNSYYRILSLWNSEYVLRASLLKVGTTLTVWEGTEDFVYRFTLGDVTKPVFGHAAGEVESGTKITLTALPNTAEIYYTLNNQEAYKKYDTASAGIAISKDTTIWAYAAVDKHGNMVCSDTVSVRYTVKGGGEFEYRVVSPADKGGNGIDKFDSVYAENNVKPTFEVGVSGTDVHWGNSATGDIYAYMKAYEIVNGAALKDAEVEMGNAYTQTATITPTVMPFTAGKAYKVDFTFYKVTDITDGKINTETLETVTRYIKIGGSGGQPTADPVLTLVTPYDDGTTKIDSTYTTRHPGFKVKLENAEFGREVGKAQIKLAVYPGAMSMDAAIDYQGIMGNVIEEYFTTADIVMSKTLADGTYTALLSLMESDGTATPAAWITSGGKYLDVVCQFKVESSEAEQLEPPVDLQAYVKEDTAFLSWAVGTPGDSYRLVLQQDGQTLADTLIETDFYDKTSSFVCGGLTEGVYTWKVRAEVSEKYSEWVNGPVFFFGSVPAPVFSVPSGSEVERGDTIRISAVGDAKVLYGIGENAEPETEGDFVVISADTTYIYAVAVLDNDTSALVKAVYYVKAGESSAVEAEVLAGVKVYPNPNVGNFRVEVPEAALVEIYAMNGVLSVRERVAAGVSAFELKTSGIYFVRVTAGTRTVVKRVVVR